MRKRVLVAVLGLVAALVLAWLAVLLAPAAIPRPRPPEPEPQAIPPRVIKRNKALLQKLRQQGDLRKTEDLQAAEEARRRAKPLPSPALKKLARPGS